MTTRQRPRLTVSIIAHNEARDLHACLNSIRGLADETIVVDCASDDDTALVARRFKQVRVFRRPNLANLNVNKAYGVARARTEWVLYMDPDERVTPDLRRAILAAVSSDRETAAYDIPRRNYYFGRWLKHGGKYPDYQRRLFRRSLARFPAKHVHEKLSVRGAVERLTAPMDHHPYPDLNAFFRKLLFYAKFQADFISRAGAKPGPAIAFMYLLWTPGSRFLRRFVLRAGFLDGIPGFLACIHDALTHILTYAILSRKV